MESFIRSKYESRRWALDGPPPADPSVLDTGASAEQPAPPPPVPAPTQPQYATSSRPTHAPTNSFSTRAPAAAPITTRQPQGHQLLSSNYVNRPTGPVPAPQPTAAPAPAPQPALPPKAPENDLFSLDFHAPAAPAVPEPKKDVKQDILSLFATAPAAAAPVAAGFGQFASQTAQWGAPPQTAQWGAPAPVQQQPPQTSMMGNSGSGMWGASSGWTGAVAAQPQVWGTPAAQAIPQQQMFNTNAVWGTPAAPAAAPAPDPFAAFSTVAQPAVKKDDVFGDIWGGFK